MKYDPMPMLSIAAIARINEHFNRRGIELADIDHAHARKRKIAAAVMAGETISEDHPFAQEAIMREVNLTDFAQRVANKRDDISHRERHRQLTILQIESAATPAELDDIVKTIG